MENKYESPWTNNNHWTTEASNLGQAHKNILININIYVPNQLGVLMALLFK